MTVVARIPGEPVAAGHNLTPFEQSRVEIEDLFVEARNWLDGASIQTQAEADAIGKLLDLIGAAIKLADTRREVEAQPFNEGKAEVQDRYNTLIGNTKCATGRAIILRKALRDALTPWNLAREAERQEAARAAQEVADRARREAALALQMSDATDIAAREEAEALNRTAKAREAEARRAAKRVATGLRRHVRAEVTDHRAFARWAWENRQHELFGMLQTLAERLSDQKTRGLPGVTYHDEARAQ